MLAFTHRGHHFMAAAERLQWFVSSQSCLRIELVKSDANDCLFLSCSSVAARNTWQGASRSDQAGVLRPATAN